jgi:hypothetical protein
MIFYILVYLLIGFLTVCATALFRPETYRDEKEMEVLNLILIQMVLWIVIIPCVCMVNIVKWLSSRGKDTK